MGCDIHFYTEKRNTETGKWELVDETERKDDGEGGTYLTTNYRKALYDSRSYNLFAILADVRNGRGFAGFNPISEPRGIPEDASAEYKEIAEQMGCDGHSHSHHTLRQLLDYDWTQSTQLQGWCGVAEWLKWSRWDRQQGFGPDEYCGGVTGRDVCHIEAEEMDTLTKPALYLRGDELKAFVQQHQGKYALAVWQVPYYRAASGFMSETIPQLLAIAGGVDGADNVRIVFFFDN